jgi:hypothetical protein
VFTQIGKFILGSFMGSFVPISLAWAQYVHPLNFPKMPQIEKIPSEYLLNIPRGNSLEELEQDSGWIEVKEEAFHSDYEMQGTNLNDLNSSYEDFGMHDEFKNAEISISSIKLEKPVLKHSSKSSDPELDHTFALTNLIESTLQHTASTSINNPIDTNWIEAYHPKDIAGEIETYPSHPSVFIRNSLVRHIENHGMTSDKVSDKKPTENLSYNEVLTSYPLFSGITSSTPLAFYNIFEANPAESFSSEESSPEKPHAIVSRQRRSSHHIYYWEMTDFADYDNSENDILYFNGNFSSDTFTIIIKPLTGGAGVGTGNNGQDQNNSATQGVSGNMPVYPDNAIWSPPTRTFSNFLQFNSSNVPIVNVDASAVKYFMNWHYGDWDAEQVGNNFNLVYYSAVPEPSTYFMTGALFCFIGCNRSSRNTFKSMLSKVFKHSKTKDNTEDIQDRIS